MSFEIKIPLFEGPFDLLLFFIKRDEIDIHDIPIAKITDDFLQYIDNLEHLNLEVAGEFLLMAATLMRIKAKMLLPRVEKDEDDVEIDPRAELVRHLLEYKRYKATLSVFESWEDNMLARHKRGNIAQELQKISAPGELDIELQDLTLFKLLSAYKKILAQASYREKKDTHKVVPFAYNIDTQKQFIFAELEKNTRLSFVVLLKKDYTRVALVFNFLAILDLVALGQITIILGEGFNNFWIARKSEKNLST